MNNFQIFNLFVLIAASAFLGHVLALAIVAWLEHRAEKKFLKQVKESCPKLEQKIEEMIELLEKS